MCCSGDVQGSCLLPAAADRQDGLRLGLPLDRGQEQRRRTWPHLAASWAQKGNRRGKGAAGRTRRTAVGVLVLVGVESMDKYREHALDYLQKELKPERRACLRGAPEAPHPQQTHQGSVFSAAPAH